MKVLPVILFSAVSCLGWTSRSLAQSIITPDASLGAEGSIVSPRNGFDGITGGATRGTGLFHSFSQFDINNPAGAYFLVKPEVQNIFARVTGGQGSVINGAIGTRIDDAALSASSASLFLLNPNGILFGPNARLDLGGSFLATTASSFKFGERQEFSAANPQAAPLLTVAVPLGLQFGERVGGLEVNGANLNTSAIGRSLSLIGGNVRLVNGELLSIAGQLDIGAVGAGEFVGLTPLRTGWRADYAGVKSFQDIQLDRMGLSNGAIRIADFAVFPVDLNLQGRRISGINQSGLYSLYQDAQSPGLQSGKIRLNASERIDLDNSIILASSDGTVPTSGIEIDTRVLTLSNNTNILLRQDGERAGNIDIRTSQSALLQDGVAGKSQILSINSSEGDVQGGTINLVSPLLEIYGGSSLSTLLVNKGKAGDINLKVDRLVVSGERRSPQAGQTGVQSAITSGSSSSSSGDTGNINIAANSIDLLNGGYISIARFGQGKSGIIDLQVRDAVTISASSSDGFPSGIRQAQSSTTIQPLSIPSSPGIKMRAKRLLVADGGEITTRILGDGDALGINIQVDEDVTIQGTSPNPLVLSSGDLIFSTSSISSSRFNGSGDNGGRNSGDIEIRAKAVRLLEGGKITSDISITETIMAPPTASVIPLQGKAGDIIIIASNNVIVDGQERRSLSTRGDAFSSSSISTSVRDANVQGGKIAIQTGNLLVSNGGRVQSDTLGRGGQAGSIAVNATGNVTVTGSGRGLVGSPSEISSSGVFQEAGNAGSVAIQAQSLNILDGGLVAATTSGRGDGGDINIQVSDDINIQGISPQGFRSRITASAASQEQATPEELARLAATIQLLGGNLDFFIPADQLGNGGTISLSARNLNAGAGSFISAISEGAGNAGNISIDLRDRALLNDTEIRTASIQTSGGNIDLNARAIVLRNDSNIKTNIRVGSGSGGNINLTAPGGIVLLDDSDILAFAQDGKGGNITLRTPALLTRTYKPSPTNTDLSTLDQNGFIDINATGAISGIITLPTLNPLQNNRPALPNTLVDPSNQLSRSCIARNPQTGKFYITGAGGIPPQPGEPSPSIYSTLPVQASTPPIVEADGVYPIADGKFSIGRRCIDKSD
jgi:filamentous hemagglutinin family protein